MTWQEPVAAIIIGLAVVSLYRHLRGMFGSAGPDAEASCHGCDDCATETTATPASPQIQPPSPPQSNRIH